MADHQSGLAEVADRVRGGVVAAAGVSVGAPRPQPTPAQRERVEWADVHPVPLLHAVSADGTVDYPDMLGPHDGYWWDVRRVALSGFTAGTVKMYRNDANGADLAEWTQTGEWTWSGALLLAPRDRLIFVTSGLTGSVKLDGTAIEVAARALPLYLI